MRLATLIALLTLAGCSEPTIDGSSDEAFGESLRDVAESMPENRRDSLAAAMLKLSYSLMTPEMLLSQPDSTAMMAAVRSSVDGMTGEEVIVAGRNAREPDLGGLLGAALGAAFSGGLAGEGGGGDPSPYDDSVSVERLETRAGSFGDGLITAVVTNRSKRALQSVEVSFDLFEADGVRARSTPPDRITDLPAGQSARVSSDYYESEGIDSVAVGEVRATVEPSTP